MPPAVTVTPMLLATGDELLCAVCHKSVEAESFKHSDCAQNGVVVVDASGRLVGVAWAHRLCVATPLYRSGPRFATPRCLRCDGRITSRPDDPHRFGEESDGIPVVFCADGGQGWLESWPPLIGPMQQLQQYRAAKSADCGVATTV